MYEVTRCWVATLLSHLSSIVVTALAAYAMLASPNVLAYQTVIRKPVASDPTAEPYDMARDAPILIVFGQSNATGAQTFMTDEEDISKCTNMPNVKGLSRASNLVQNATSVEWSNYSCFGYNLGSEYNGGYAYHLAGNFARQWQAAIDSGITTLPDLYVIHIAWGAQGFLRLDDDFGKGRWYHRRDPNDIESLYPLAINKLKMAVAGLVAAGKRPRVIGLHWNQWEAEVKNGSVSSVADAQAKFARFLNRFRVALGGSNFPIYLYFPRSDAAAQSETGGYIKQAFVNLTADTNQNFQMLDAADAVSADGVPLYKPNASFDSGIMVTTNGRGGVHYTKDVQLWFSRKQMKFVLKHHNYGVPVGGP